MLVLAFTILPHHHPAAVAAAAAAACRPAAGEEELRQKQLQTFCGMMLERYEDEVLAALTTDAFSTQGEQQQRSWYRSCSSWDSSLGAKLTHLNCKASGAIHRCLAMRLQLRSCPTNPCMPCKKGLLLFNTWCAVHGVQVPRLCCASRSAASVTASSTSSCSWLQPLLMSAAAEVPRLSCNGVSNMQHQRAHQQVVIWDIV
jgi:hypothetical protein